MNPMGPTAMPPHDPGNENGDGYEIMDDDGANKGSFSVTVS